MYAHERNVVIEITLTLGIILAQSDVQQIAPICWMAEILEHNRYG